MTLVRARAIVAQINAAQPDVILLPGDFIADREDPETDADERAAGLRALDVIAGRHALTGSPLLRVRHRWKRDRAERREPEPKSQPTDASSHARKRGRGATLTNDTI